MEDDPSHCTTDGVAKVRIEDVMEILGDIYGPVEWKPRYDPASELVYTILSQHTSDTNSIRAYKNLISSFSTLDLIASAEVADIQEAIKSGGLANIKAARIKAILNQIKSELGSFDLSFLAEMPLSDAKKWLKRLDGIGPKTAAIILCFSFGLPAMPVDTHIHRVARRLGLIGQKTSAEEAHDILESMVRPIDVFPFHMYLINHGRQICQARSPNCAGCALSWGCPSNENTKKNTGL